MTNIAGDYVVIGGGIAGVTCAEVLSSLVPDKNIILITASQLIKAVTNHKQISRTLESFDVEERPASSLYNTCPNLKVLEKQIISLSSDTHKLKSADGCTISYSLLCICTGGKAKILSGDNPYVLGIRDTESVQEFHKRLVKARRVVIVGNGGIATELVYEIEGCEVVWAIKDDSISSTFFDPGAAQFFLPQLSTAKPKGDNQPVKRTKYTLEYISRTRRQQTTLGGALGPDWSADLCMTGTGKESHNIEVEYNVEVSKIFTPEEFHRLNKSEGSQNNGSATSNEGHAKTADWPVFVELTNGKVFGCDFVVSATGVLPNTGPLLTGNQFTVADDGGLKVNSKMMTSVLDVYAAGDVCSASWQHAPQWLQMRLWSQARHMGAYSAQCMVAQTKGEDIQMDFCFEMFAHCTKFFNYKVILLGKFNAQGFGKDHEILLRVSKGVEFIKVILKDNKMQGAILIGETDLEETFENLIINGMDLSAFKEHLLDPNIDVEDFFD